MDFAKEALFNILTNTFDIPSLRVLDLFGGTGNHSYEFISRGCKDVTFVDKFPACVAFAKKTAQTLGIEEHIHIVRADVFRFIAQPQQPYDYIFADPPYALSNIADLPDLIFQYHLLRPDGWLVVEHGRKDDFQKHPRIHDVRQYGTTVFSVFTHPSYKEGTRKL